MSKPKPRKALGVLESMALFFILAREYNKLGTSANDLFAEFSGVNGREVSPSGIYLLLGALENKGLVAHAPYVNIDALGRPRQIRYYDVTPRGKELARTEYNVQSAIIEQVRPALTRAATA